MSTQVTGVTPGSQLQPTHERPSSASGSKSDAVGGRDSAEEADEEVKAVEQPTTVEVTSDSAHRNNEALGKHVDTFV